MWAELLDWACRTMLKQGNELADEVDSAIPLCVNTIQEVAAAIREKRERWLSSQP
jgi:hypothetical protein